MKDRDGLMASSGGRDVESEGTAVVTGRPTDAIEALVGLYEAEEIWDGMEESSLRQVFCSYGVPAYKQFLALVPQQNVIEIEDERIKGLVTILNLLGCPTTSSCSGHGDTLPFLVFSIRNMTDYNHIHRVLTGSGAAIDRFFNRLFGKNRFQLETLEDGMRIDLHCDESDLDEFAAWLFFWRLQDYMLDLNWHWPTAIIDILKEAALVQ
jgi:hypothetical protein